MEPNKHKKYRDKMDATKGKEVRGIRAKGEYHERIRAGADKLIKRLDNLQNIDDNELSRTGDMKLFTDWMNEGVDEKHAESEYLFTKRLLLADGTSLSIQAGEGKYCRPRRNPDVADYDFFQKFEVGFPSCEIQEIMTYAENPDDPTETVYGYVPKKVIQKMIEARGGVAGYDSKKLKLNFDGTQEG